MLAPFLISLTLITGTLAQNNQTSVVSGRVVYEDTGQPASRHRVQLIASEALLRATQGLHIPTTMTNERGEFGLARVTAGDYYVVVQPIDQHGSNSELTSVLIRSGDSAADAANVEKFKKNNLRITVDGQHNVDVNLRVTNLHFGTVSGMVFDAMHQPAARAMVHVVSKDNDSGSTVFADDEGRYKVFGLRKGEYIVSANPPSKGERMELQGSPGATYYPSTLVLQDSPPVVVLPDLDTSKIEITLALRALRSVGGTVRMRGDNRPLADATVRLGLKAAGGHNQLSHYLTSTNQNGRWSFSNVPDGSYRIYVQPSGIPANPRFVQLEQDLVVSGADIEDLQIEVSEGARLAGVVTLEGGGAAPQYMEVVATSHKLHANSIVRLDEAGKFAMTAVPAGEIVVSAFAFPENKFYVKSIEANGVDLLRNNITVAEADEIKEVRVVVSTAVGVITGRVLSGDRPVAGANVMLKRITGDGLRLFGGKLTTVTDAQGAFTVSAAPGNYFVIAWRTDDGPTALATAMEKAKREQGTGVTLSPSMRKEMDVRLP
jgi:hypothetical protein